MKKLKNVLYIMTPGSSLSVKNRSICVKNSGGTHTVPVHNIESVICFGDMNITTPFMEFCARNSVKLVFLSCYGRYYGAFYGIQRGNVFLRREQYRRFDDYGIKLEISKKIIIAKLKNSSRVLSKSLPENHEAGIAVSYLRELQKNIQYAADIDAVRGYEGAAAAKYFSLFDDMLHTEENDMKFVKRTRRPPENNVNSLLSFVYTLLVTDITAAVESTGLDIQVGVMHTEDYARPSLVLDLAEEFRSPLCDRFVISLINRKMITSDDFVKNESGEIFLTDTARKKVVSEWQVKKKTEVYHEEYDRKVCAGLLFYLQAAVMSEYLRGERAEYKPYIWR